MGHEQKEFSLGTSVFLVLFVKIYCSLTVSRLLSKQLTNQVSPVAGAETQTQVL